MVYHWLHLSGPSWQDMGFQWLDLDRQQGLSVAHLGRNGLSVVTSWQEAGLISDPSWQEWFFIGCTSWQEAGLISGHQGSPAGRGYMFLGRGYLFWPWLFVPGRGYLFFSKKNL